MKKFLIIIGIVIIVLVPLIFISPKKATNTKIETDINKLSEVDKLSKLVTEDAHVTSYTTYGRFFNIEGEIATLAKDLVLILKNEDAEESYDLILTETNDGTVFKTSNLINQGINLDKIPSGTYVILLKSGSSDNVKYYTLSGDSLNEDIHYYTTTKDKINKELTFQLKEYDAKTYLMLDVKEAKLPEDVYDVVVDPGHGGIDVGANKNGHYESQINLDYALKLKKSLENIGLKVKLTREKDESIPNYGDNSRVSIAYEAKAKLLLSIHQNSATYNVGNGGVEIYVPNHADTTFAFNLAKNIVDNTSTIYSKNVAHKIDSGVYLRTLSESDLADIKKEAEKKGYAYYEKATTDSTYYFIIRETGGIVTGAYVDDRYKEKPWNTYYNSNQGLESYLLELGYINSLTNLNILLTEQDKYIEAITKTVKEYLEI